MIQMMYQYDMSEICLKRKRQMIVFKNNRKKKIIVDKYKNIDGI